MNKPVNTNSKALNLSLIKGEGIKRKLLPPLVIAILLLLGGNIWILFEDRKQRIQEAEEVTRQRVEDLLQEEMSRDVEKMSSTLEAIIRDRVLLSAFQARDREALLKRGRPLFSRLKEQHKIGYFHFHLPNFTNLVRMDKERRGDFINRQTIKRALKTNLPSAGLEQGHAGNPVLRVVYPWYSNFPLFP